MDVVKVPRLFLGIAGALALGFLLGHFYGVIGRAQGEGWAIILGLHSAVGLLVLYYLPPSLRLQPLMSPLRSLRGAGVLLVAIFMVSICSRLFGSLPVSASNYFDFKALVLIIWVPWAEELVFRGGIGRIFEVWLGDWWGRYGSALIFALAHGGGTISSIYLPNIPIGPFLLGWCCSLSYSLTGRISAPIGLHAVCNASAVIFANFDPRWLEWLNVLYAKV